MRYVFVRAVKIFRNHACMTYVLFLICRPLTLSISFFDSNIIQSSAHEYQASSVGLTDSPALNKHHFFKSYFMLHLGFKNELNINWIDSICDLRLD